MEVLNRIGCIGFTKPVHCLIAVVAISLNILVRGVRLSRNAVKSVTAANYAGTDILLKPACSYGVIMALHFLAVCYFANQFTLVRRQEAIAKCVCLIHLLISLLTFLSGLVAFLPMAADDDLFTVLAESISFFVLVSDISKPLRIVQVSIINRSALSFSFIAVLKENFLDLLMQLLIISLGVLFRLPAVLRACTYAAIGLTSSFLSFYLVVPSVLSVTMSLDTKFRVDSSTDSGSSTKRPNQLHPASPNEKASELSVTSDSNPLARRVKFIMSAAILLVHAHSKLRPTSSPVSLPETSSYLSSKTSERVENMSVDQSNQKVSQSFASSKRLEDWSEFDEVSAADWGLTLVLAVVICLRFLLFSDSPSYESNSCETSGQTENLTPPKTPLFSSALGNELSLSSQVNSNCNDIDSKRAKDHFRPARKRLISDASLIAKTNEEIIEYFVANGLPLYTLETKLMSDIGGKEIGATRAVAIRRGILCRQHPKIAAAISKVPYADYREFSTVVGACCENVIGTVPLPVGLAGPLLIDNVEYMLPMATTEGCLVASVNRGCKVLTQSGGVRTVLLNDGMSRAPVVRLPDIKSAAGLRSWLKDPQNFDKIAEIFNGTSRFCRLTCIEPYQAGVYLYIRFVAQTGDAMGMNMVSRACESALSFIISNFPACRLLSLSGNACADKKSAAVNWLMGRGKSVISEAIIPRQVVCDALRTTPESLVRLNTAKNLIGSAMAGAVSGGFNAHAANILTALYIATGQDVAQVVESSACLTILELTSNTPVTSVDEEPVGGDLHITCTLPTLEVGTVGGGTVLGPQRSCLDIIGVGGSAVGGDEDSYPGDNARKLARVAAAAVLAGELSLLAALATNQLMPAHLRLNRSQLNMCPSKVSEESARS